MAEGVVLADAQGNLLDWNKAALDMHGYTRVEDVRINLADLEADVERYDTDGNRVPFSQWPMSRLVRGETICNQEVRIHRRGRSPDLNIIFNGTLIRDADGQVRFALLTLHNASKDRQSKAKIPDQIPRLQDPLSEPDPEQDKRSVKEAADAEKLLDQLDFTFAERDFCLSLGQRLVEEAADAYVTTSQQGRGCDGSCIAASLVIALLIVNDL